jgi:hypothetical protein
MRKALFLIALLALPALAADDSGMRAAANGFYGVYKSISLSDGIPDGKLRARYEPFLSPALDQALIAAQTAQRRFAAANKDAPPLLEGDIFTSNFEGATSVTVGACSGNADKGQCAIQLGYDNHKSGSANWTDTLYLVRSAQGWRADDIGYGGNAAFGNRGRLSDTLKSAVAMMR